MPDFAPPQVLHEGHDVRGFDCGKPPLDEFLRLHALDKQRAMLSRTYVVTDGTARVAGHHTLAHVSVAAEESPRKIGRGMPSSIPALLLARLAVDRAFQGRGLGHALFADALARAHAVMEAGPAPVRVLVVDALDEDALRFYEGYRMIPSPTRPLRLFLSSKDVRAVFAP